MLRSLKFLDPYTKEDKRYYYGRESQTELLYSLVKDNQITLFYGLSGTGKTSLIQCGLSNKFDESDWLPFTIRRGNKIDIITAIKNCFDAGDNDVEDVILLLNKVYYKYFRPTFLIFDQFEELFIFGTPNEKKAFIAFLLEIKKKSQFIKVILVLREEYFVHLDDFETEIPEIFQSRLRLEPMEIDEVRKTISKIGKTLRLEITEKIADEIITHITSKSSDYQSNNNIGTIVKNKVELTYLQVYFQEMVENKLSEKLRNLPVNECLILEYEDLPELGAFDDLLSEFLDCSVKNIHSELKNDDPDLNLETIWQILNSLVSYEGTKQEKKIEEIKKTLL